MKLKGNRCVYRNAHLLSGRAEANLKSVFGVKIAGVDVGDFNCPIGGVATILPGPNHPVDLEDARLGAVIDRMDRMDFSGGEMEFLLSMTVKFSYLRGERERRGWGAVFRLFEFNFNRCPDAKVLVFLRFRILFLKIKDVSPIIVKND